MTRAEFAKGSATFLVVIVAGLLSETYLDRHLAVVERADIIAEMPRGSLGAQLLRCHMRRNSTPITSTT